MDAEKTVRITIACTQGLKRDAKKAILKKGIDRFGDEYLKIFEMGLKEYSKGGIKKDDE